GVPTVNSRAVPDISLAAGGIEGYRAMSDGIAWVVGGTSLATPSFAGILALMNQYQIAKGTQTQAGLGTINPRLYGLAKPTPGVFHDIISGGNVVPCLTSTVDCSLGTFGYLAGTGYDLATGLGSVDASNLVSSLSTEANATAITVSPGSVLQGGGDFKL